MEKNQAGVKQAGKKERFNPEIGSRVPILGGSKGD